MYLGVGTNTLRAALRTVLACVMVSGRVPGLLVRGVLVSSVGRKENVERGERLLLVAVFVGAFLGRSREGTFNFALET